MKNKIISIVIPCFNEEEVIAETIKRITEFSDKLKKYDVELLFIDDGSEDQTFYLLKSFSKRDTRIKVLRFSRNFGHQIAVTAGIDVAIGDVVVLVDADLQDPPEVIGEMIQKWEEGYDVVYGTRTERIGESWFKKVTARLFYRGLNKISEVPIPLDTGDFRLMSRSVVDVLLAMPEKDRFIRGMVSWVGFKQIGLMYKRNERFAGVSKYPLKKMIRFASDGIFSFSTKPLKLAINLGLLSAFISLGVIFYALVLRLFTSIWIEGWTALMISVLFIGGVQLICLGIVGEYIGRIYREIKSRPMYVVSEHVGFKEIPKFTRSPVINLVNYE